MNDRVHATVGPCNACFNKRRVVMLNGLHLCSTCTRKIISGWAVLGRIYAAVAQELVNEGNHEIGNTVADPGGAKVTPRVTLGCDPGNNTGIAWGLDGRLFACYLAHPGETLVVPLGFAINLDTGHLLEPTHAVFEYPKFYGAKAYGTASAAYGVANALIRESVTLGGFKQQAAALGATCEEIFPRVWKGTLPKRAMLKIIWAALDARERALVKALGLPPSLLHNVLDAIGIMLWSVGRLELKRFS